MVCDELATPRGPGSRQGPRCAGHIAAFKEKNLLLSTFAGTFSKEKNLVYATALSDPAGAASAVYGVSRKAMRWGAWVENQPTWFVVDRKGTITYKAHPPFNTPTSYVADIDLVLEALRKAD